MSDYQRISCETHSIYELAIMRGQSIQVNIDGRTQTIQPKDIITKISAEYLIFMDEDNVQQELRADKIILQDIL
ncbi:MAG TPA: transcriptional antiterminator, Rof [Gammaproteobacteria bacterium]|nr:transcriptional antiterminator, Rof [Gammaproteobacteria bacterium]HBA95814.1 transcriptional antiterminator, Rof [Gammaproteobacteria bacterium]HCF48436.1 transcriptional antiterminator, Rof [Gammaproteobacteria bacterium]HCH58207.1 transcriptional antiterminator, Rof [Gammaproteobacteria bacterium]HCV92483.1 transcriptional antiterminator, Rof [Gammaproteobacteria bacterium]